MILPEPLEILIEELNKLPSIGRKTAQRLALYLLKSDKNEISNLINSLIGLRDKIRLCKTCFNVAVDEECEICKSHKRDSSIICVVEEVSDVIAIEKTNEYQGLYHVLGGVLSPLGGKNSESLRINELIQRIKNNSINEIILALNPDTEGESTALYLAKILKEFNIKITRIARGLPIGGDIEFADEATIGRAVSGRISIL